MGEGRGSAHSADKAFFKFIILILMGTLTVSRVKITLMSTPLPPWYEIVLFFDVPLLLFLLAVLLLAHLMSGGEIRIRNFWSFAPIPLLLAWLLLSGILMAQKPMFFAAGYGQWVLAYLAFLLLPPLLARFGLIDYAVDAFLAWSIAGGVAHLGMTVLHPDQVLVGVASVFGGNRAHVGFYFLIALATAVYAWSQRQRKLHGVAMTIAVLCVLTSGSRASQMAAVLFLVLLIISTRSAKMIALGLPAIAGLIGLFKLILADRGSDAFAVAKGVNIDASAGYRLLIWLKSWEIITQSQEHFLFGIGYSNFRFLFYKLVYTPFYANAAHNVYLHYWVETGLIGLLLLLLVCLSLLVYCWRHGRHEPGLRSMGFLVLGALFTGLTQETFVPAPFNGNVLTLFFLIMGLTTYKAARDLPADVPEREPGPLPA